MFDHGRADWIRCIRAGWITVAVFFVIFILVSSFMPLDAGVPIDATIVVSGNKKSVQSIVAGKISDIFIAEGDKVVSGQPLIKLESSQVTSQFRTIKFQYLSNLALRDRLISEIDGKQNIRFCDEINKEIERGNSVVEGIVNNQNLLLESRLRTQLTTLTKLEDSLYNVSKQREAALSNLMLREKQSALFSRQLNNQRILARDGLLARNRLFETERQYMQLLSIISDGNNNLEILSGEIHSLKSAIKLQKDVYEKELLGDLFAVRIRISELQTKLEKSQHDIENNTIIAPSSGVVTGLTVFTQGGIVGMGDMLMEIVPFDRPLAVEGKIPVNQIDKIKVGQSVDLEFMSFSRSLTPKLTGLVKNISADRFIDKNDNPYYRVDIYVKNTRDREIAPGMMMQPGMPVTAFVKTGERTLINYLTKPLRDRIRFAVQES